MDVRYLDKHRLPDLRPIYQITILENHSRAVLASAVSRTQDQWAYLKVLFSALSTADIPKGIVSDGGKIFSSKQAMFVYNFLGIRKAQIDAGQPWQDYVESIFNVARRMADFEIEQAETWEELLSIHQQWVKDYNSQKHWAHRDRQDGRHSPSEVLGWVKGTMYPEEVLNRVLFATRYTRHLNPLWLSALPQHWKFYGEFDLADKPVTLWVHEGNLEVEYRATTLAEYDVKLHEDHRRMREVSNPRLVDTHFRSPQLTLLDVGPDDWKLFWHLPEFPVKPRKRKGAGLMQPTLFDATALAQATFVAPPQPLLRLVPKEAPAPEPES